MEALQASVYGTETLGKRDRSKRCPRCGALLFEDMDICYGCLYDFAACHETNGVADLLGWKEEDMWTAASSFDEPAPFSYMPREATAPQSVEECEGMKFMSGASSPKADDAPWDWWGCEFEDEDVYAQDAESMFVANTDPGYYANVVDVRRDRSARSRLSAQETTALPGPAHMRTCWALTVEAGSVRMVRPVPPQGLSIGRAQDNDIVLCDRLVSRNHVRVIPVGMGVQVVDLGSTNPATISGRPVENSCLLREGEPLIIGRTVFFLIPHE